MSDQEISVRAFLRDLRWMLPLALGAAILLVLLKDGWTGYRELLEVLLPTGLGVVVLGPLLWLWWGSYTRYAKDPAMWRFAGGSVVWAIFSMIVIFLILDAFGIE